MKATLNDSFPGHTPPGTEVELLTQHGTTATVRIGKKTVKVSTRWLDFGKDEGAVKERVKARGLRIREGMFS